MKEALDRVSTGVGGLDEVLDGGLVADRTYMIRGQPGAGKSILGLEFLVAGVDAGEDVLYVNMEEPEREIRQNAASLGIDLEDVAFLDLSPDSEFFAADMSYDIFASDEVEGGELTDRITERVETLAPDRIFVDPISQLRQLSPDEYQFRKEVLSFMQFLKEQGATVLFTSQATATTPDDDLQFMCDGVVELDRTEKGRTVTVPKFRGSGTLDGEHALRIREGGIEVYPRLLPRHHQKAFPNETLPSGVPELDKLLNGGIERGTVTIVTGSPGVGKTTTGVQFMKEAAGRGERSVVYSFEEAKNTLVHRCESINMPVETMMEKGTLAIEEVEALRLSATEFAHMVREEVEANDTSIVMIDGVEGYKQALRDADEELARELHSVCRYLKNMGVTVILMNEIPTVVGEFQLTQAGLSYLSDSIVFIQHIEMNSRMRKVIGVLKKRTSDFERNVRQFRITEYGVEIGEPLDGLTGILTGNPTYENADPGVGSRSRERAREKTRNVFGDDDDRAGKRGPPRQHHAGDDHGTDWP
ncbi:ATPase domain-containing protein [Halomarina oriensis]|uniref:non-specific serine/threonine protein kinase n=1 Tax=Halomarina oriensis TaxID=671145 RepID=A0A6B0GI03_9EURY|nr:ATPase domain-containing protein [Halomarina oriensis]MWG33059.1 AAA family ATPase [Halomarina oriensis]